MARLCRAARQIAVHAQADLRAFVGQGVAGNNQGNC